MYARLADNRDARVSSGNRDSADSDNVVFVNNLPSDTTEVQLRKLFERSGTYFVRLIYSLKSTHTRSNTTGTIERIGLPLDRSTGMIRGMAFIHMASYSQALKCCVLDGSMLGENMIGVRLSRKKEER